MLVVRATCPIKAKRREEVVKFSVNKATEFER